MNTISYDIDFYYNDFLLKEIEEICNKPYRLYREVEMFIISFKAKRQVKKILKFNKQIIESVYKMDFAKVLEIEKRATTILESLSQAEEMCRNCTHSKCKEKYLGSYFVPLKDSFTILHTTMNNSYHLDANSIFKSEEDYRQNNEALKAFADLWDDESTLEEEEFVFKHNVEKNAV
jgi:hypothetical protein